MTEGSAPSPPLVDRRQLAARWGLSPRRITLYVDDGMPVAKGGGRGKSATFDLAACEAWRANRTSKNTNLGSLAEARAGHARAQARLTELSIRQREGELIPRDDALRAGALVVTAVKAKLLALPSAVAERCVQAAAEGGAAAVRAVLAPAIRNALTDLKTWTPKKDWRAKG